MGMLWYHYDRVEEKEMPKETFEAKVVEEAEPIAQPNVEKKKKK